MMIITGSVLETVGAPIPFADSTPIAVRQLTLDPPGPTECLVQIEAAGICHSDLSVVTGDRVRPVPMLLGHEAAGRVVEIGSEVTDVRVGQRVIMTFLPRCETCKACRTGGRVPCEIGSVRNNAGQLFSGDVRLHDDHGDVLHHLGVSAFADHAVVDQRSLVPIADDVPADIAALFGCAVLTGGGAVWNIAKPAPGSSLAVLGLGGVGMAAVLTALAEPDVEVIAIDPLAAKRDLAARLGAHRTLTPEEAVTEGLRVDAVVEASGHPSAVGTGVDLLAAGGVLAITGLTAPDATTTISPLRLVGLALTISGCYLGSSVPRRDIPRFIELWREGRLPLAGIISHRIPMSALAEEINPAMDRLDRGEALRQIITVD
jgi:alcohol dehydrogenase